MARSGVCRCSVARRADWAPRRSHGSAGRLTASSLSYAMETIFFWRRAMAANRAEYCDRWHRERPSWSPDGSILRFTLSDPQTNDRSIWQALPDGGNLHPLLPGWDSTPNECCGKWTPDGRYFVFQAARDETVDLWALREQDGVLSRSAKGADAINEWAYERRQSRPEPRWQRNSSPKAGGLEVNWFATMPSLDS